MPESARIEVRGGDDWVTRNKMDRFIATIELIAAFFIGLVAVDIFLTVVLRNFFSMALPDSYDIGQLLLGILIFWGIAATSYRGTHITVDVVWANASPRYQRWIDVFATLVLLFVVAMQTYSLVDKVASNYNANLQTFELRLPTWPFLAARLGRRRCGGAADRDPHLPTDLPTRSDGAQPARHQAGGVTTWIPMSLPLSDLSLCSA